jgi:PQQ-dependent catabolism-associated CXXCW motif protein
MTVATFRYAMLVLAMLASAHIPALAQDVPEPDGYRMESYRGPTPVTLTGARVVTTAEAQDIWQNGHAVFLDVLPRPPRPANLPPGTLWREPPRLDIPGSLWLPDTGYGALAPAMEGYLQDNIARATHGERDKLVVVYCQRSCWMSWNAAKRILSKGYTNVAWYPDGTDGWTEANLPVQPSTPVPRPEQ